MLPLYDENPTYERPYVTYAIIGMNAIVFLIMVFIEYGLGKYELVRFYYDWALLPAYVWNGERMFTLITSMFMHGGFLHFGGNMLYLYIFGNNVEDSMGHWKYLIFYVICGLAASYSQIIMDTSSTVPMLGASGAIAGVLGAYLVTFPKTNVYTLVLYMVAKVPAVFVLSFWFILQLFNGLGSIGVEGGVAYFAHIGGFVCGALLAGIFRKRGYKAQTRIKQDW
ncbi:MAG TPA: rhomboid family intramembrane serine protease, partial [Candidatus Methanofastidiosa archaeon]|nr:rhomboid family intramembrane serine protease [Candidatus Methanofastidiosa archaeon]